MMKGILTLILMVCLSAFGQHILDNSNGQVLLEKPFFSQEFIKKAKIRKIKGYYSTKASRDIIRTSGDHYTYEFDKQGRLIREYLTRDNDTVVKLYTYDAESRIQYTAESNYFGFRAEHYEYDSKNRIVLIETRRETNLYPSKLQFSRDESFEISKEKFEYIELEKGNYKKLYYNSADRVFKEEIYYHDENQKLKNQELRMIMSSARKEVLYTYDHKNRMTEMFSESWIMGHSTFKYTFEYDEIGRVLARHYFKNEEYKTEYQFLYHEQTSFLTGILTRDELTDFITILEFDEYSFYP